MNETHLYGELRELIGNPDVNAVNNRQLRSHLMASLEWLASKLKYGIRTDEKMTLLVAGQVEYPLPRDLGWVMWVSWNGNKLEPASTYGWDAVNNDWRDTTSGSPNSFAINGRKLILNPPPDATAIASDSYLSVRSITSSPGLGAEGALELAELDEQLLLYYAAVRYCASKPSDENKSRSADYMGLINALLPDALARIHHPIEDYQPKWRVKSHRTGGAR